MKKSNKIQALVIALFVAIGIAAPTASIAYNAPKDIAFEDHTTYERQEAPKTVSEEPEAELVMAEVTIRPSAKKTPSRVKETTPRCYRHELEQEGRPEARFVKVCDTL